MKTSRGPGWTLKVAGYRLHQVLGTSGMVGGALLVAAIVIVVTGWQEQQRFRFVHRNASTRPAVNMVAPQEPTVEARPILQLVDDGPALLARVQKRAVDQGLGWPKADYQFNSATNLLPASLEVRCAYKATYPAVRRFIASLLKDEPALTLRELSFSRATTEVPDVDAKLGFLIYLAPNSPVPNPVEVKP